MIGTKTAGSREVADGVWELDAPFWGYRLSLYLLESGGRWALVDSGISTAPDEFIFPFLDSRGGPAALELVIGTHGHPDHIGGNGAIKARAPHARFALHWRDVGWAENVDRNIEQMFRSSEPEAWLLGADDERSIRDALGAPVAIDHILEDRDAIEFGDARRIEVAHVGGHSPGHLVARDAQTRAVFCGDCLQGNCNLNSHTGLRDYPMYRSVREYVRGIETVRNLDASTLCTGHAGVLVGAEIGEAIDASVSWTSRFHELVRRLAAELGSFTLAELVDAVAAASPGHASPLALQIYVTTTEHLNALVQEGAVRPAIEGGVKCWNAAGG
jgi:glyoxylase-like metal-dependent hydrolase (beta-lactamase superfamily II)